MLATVVVNVLGNSNKIYKGRFILDSGSEMNLITEGFADKLGIKGYGENTFIYGIGGKIGTQSKGSLSTYIHSLSSNFKEKIKLDIVENITHSFFNGNNINITQWKIPKHIISNLADPDFDKSNKVIDGLLGASIFFKILRTQKYYPIPSKKNKGIYFLSTELGWIISGSVPANVNSGSDKQCLLAHNNQKKLTEDIFCESLFATTMKIHDNGKFIVQLPFVKDPLTLGRSLEGAKLRFQNLERKFVKYPEMKEHYKNFIMEYRQLGHLELVPDEELGKIPQFYLPHHAVVKDSTTTQWRVVFEAQYKSDNGTSLNGILGVGPNLQNDLCTLILSFRLPKYGLTADISKMFRQVWVDPRQTDLQRIVWRDSPELKLDHYRLKTVTYGTAPAPYLAMRCLRQIAQDIEHKDPKIASIISNNFYMDDLIIGADDYSELLHIKTQTEKYLKERGFVLRKWCSNSIELMAEMKSDTDHYIVDLKEEGMTKTLGLMWNPVKDNFVINIRVWNGNGVTKRTILADIQGFWDPIGLVIPAIIKGRMFLQELWLVGVHWDEILVTDLKKRWLRFREEIRALDGLEISRHVMNGIIKRKGLELHGFSDASEKAYGCCVYVSSVDSNGKRSHNLLCAKGRVAPLKATTLPRLELLAALMLARLMDKVGSLFKEDISNYYWTDSRIVLSWINKNALHWKTYVANRVQEIQDLADTNKWFHVPSKMNPADLISRGLPAQELVNCKLWWQGPVELFNNLQYWLSENRNEILTELPESKRINYSLLTTQTDYSFFERFSTWLKLQRVVAYLLRFMNNCKRNTEDRKLNELSVEEVTAARNKIIQLVQEAEFNKELIHLKNESMLPKGSRLKELSVFIHNDGLVRVGGRLNRAEYLSTDQKHPILLPPKHHVTRLIMRHTHRDNAHVGAQTLLAITRAQYWPIKGKVMAKSVVRECTICTKAKPKFQNTIMADLPKERITPGRVFSITGVDFCGPVLIKSGIRRTTKRKAYVAVFVCFKTKAIHLELVTDLSTETFMAAFKRFISRRGKPCVMYSDNGTNFVGAQRELNRLFSRPGSVIEEGAKEGIQWKFIPPNSPHFGGLWEAAVKRVKFHLFRTMGSAVLGYEETNTLLVQIEACINSRPLTPLSCDPNDFSVLTPAHFLVGGPLHAVPETSLLNTPRNRLKRWQLIQQMQQSFWNRWSKEYLVLLQQKNKWFTPSPNLKVGDLVIVKEDSIVPLKWKLARVDEVHPGPDNVVRVATVRFANGHTWKRPVVKLAPLFQEETEMKTDRH